MKKSSIILLLFIIIMAIITTNTAYSINNKKEEKLNSKNVKLTYHEKLIEHYNKYVKALEDIKLYDNNLDEVGIIKKDTKIELEETEFNKDIRYFETKINNDIYYIDYLNLEKIDNLEENNRYKKYIPFNENVITNDVTHFYDENNNLLYTINKSFNLKIIIKDTDKYGVEFDNKLLYIKKEEVIEIKENKNTEESNTKGIPVLNYHFVYEEDDNSCNEEICHSVSQIKSHFSYIKDNNFFTPTMKELEMYIDAKLQLPKSVVITFDDGTRGEVAKKYIEEYELNATIFLISSWFNKEKYESKYIEVHSHGDNIHKGGLCAGGQGGEIKCMDHDKLLKDLKTSREKLNNTTIFCYPFYEYNEYSISALKEAGFTMAFAGEYAGGKTKVSVGIDKYRLPRWVIVNYTTMDKFKSYVNGLV